MSGHPRGYPAPAWYYSHYFYRLRGPEFSLKFVGQIPPVLIQNISIRIPFFIRLKIPFKFKGPQHRHFRIRRGASSVQRISRPFRLKIWHRRRTWASRRSSHPKFQEGPRLRIVLHDLLIAAVIDGQAIVTPKKSGSDSVLFNSGFCFVHRSVSRVHAVMVCEH